MHSSCLYACHLSRINEFQLVIVSGQWCNAWGVGWGGALIENGPLTRDTCLCIVESMNHHQTQLALATWKWRARIKPSVSSSMMTTAIAEWMLPDDDGGEERAEIHSEESTHRRSFPSFFCSTSASQLACVCRFLAACLPVNLLALEAWATGPTVFPESN